MEDLKKIDYLIVPNGGGGLCAGVSNFIKSVSPATKVIGVEPEGAPSMSTALKEGGPIEIKSIDRFVDGAAVKRVGDLTYQLCKESLDEMRLVPEGMICTTILKLYNKEAIVADNFANTSDLETQIDQFVYQLYNLTAEEIDIIENGN